MVFAYARGEFDRLRFNRRNAKLSETFRQATSGLRGTEAYHRLHPLSLSVASTKVDARAVPQLNLVLPELRPDGIFAGIRTAIEMACDLSNRLQLPLRLLVLGNSPKRDDRRAIEAFVQSEFRIDFPISIVNAFELPLLHVSPNDEWVATHWTTAHACHVACQLGVINQERVTYLVQDYEPGFDPWGTTFALARATYTAGFRMVINSTPVEQFLFDTDAVRATSDLVFAPSLDLARLESSAALRADRQPGPIVILFYARPSKPRNLFGIGVSALAVAAAQFAERGLDVKFISAGEAHEDIPLGTSTDLVSRGKLPWEEYFEVLGRADVVLSLQHSPHPSHPPLDAVVSGAVAVTNEMGGTRAALHPRLLTAKADPTSLAERVVEAATETRSADRADFDTSVIGALGRSLQDVTADLARIIGGSREVGM